MELTEFLLARIAEDEELAREASARASVYGDREVTWHWLRAVSGSSMWEPTNHDPDRVLAECEAKRRIVEFMVNEVKDARRRPGWTIPAADLTNDVDRAYRTGAENQKAKQLPDVLDRTDRLFRLLALPFADHPDYDPAWKP